MRRALAVFEGNSGPEHPLTATALNNLAELLLVTNRLAEAEPLLRRALDIDERSIDSNHPNLAVRLANLGLLLRDTNRLAEAESLLRRGVRIHAEFETQNRRRHPDFETVMSSHRSVLSDMGFEEGERQVALALVAPTSFDHPKPPEIVRSDARQAIADARSAGRSTVADTLQAILDEAATQA